MMMGNKFKLVPTIHGTLDAKAVVTKLNEYDITPNTMFVSWGSWHFDLPLSEIGWMQRGVMTCFLITNTSVCS